MTDLTTIVSADSVKATLVESDISVVLEGKCLKCGYCCLPPMFFGDTPVSTNGYCRYLTDKQEDGTRLCEIQKAVETGDSKFLDSLPADAMDYWKKYCQNFPVSISQDLNLKLTVETFKRQGFPPAACGYTMTEV